MRLEVDHEDDAGHGQQPALPEVAGQLGAQVEDGHDHVRAGALRQLAQPAPGEAGQGRPARSASRAGPQEEAVQGGVRPREVPHGAAVETPQGRAQAVRQEGEDVDGPGGVAALPGPPDQFGGDRVVSGAHARGDHQQTSAALRTARGAGAAGH
ncbi:hypothetical protein RKD42_001502 [Streptomyces ambofaciens]